MTTNTAIHLATAPRVPRAGKYHRTILLLPNGDPNPFAPRKLRCRHTWPDGAACRFRPTLRVKNRKRMSFWCERHAPEGAAPLDPIILAMPQRAGYLVSLAEDRPWTPESLAVLRDAVRRLDLAHVEVPQFVRALLRERAVTSSNDKSGSDVRPTQDARATGDAGSTPAVAVAPPPGSRAVAANGGLVTIGPDKVDRLRYEAPDAEPGFNGNDAVDRLLRDMKALLTTQHVRVESPEVAALKAELALANEALARAEREFREALRERERYDAELARLKAEVARLEADNLKLIEEGVALASGTAVNWNEPRGSNAERVPSPGAVAAALMREQREAAREAEAKREREAQAAARVEARKLPEPLKQQQVAPEPEPVKAEPAKTEKAPTARAGRKARHPLIRSLPSIVADLRSHARRPEDVPPVVVLTRADKAWRDLDIADREAIVAGLRAWMNGSNARLTRVPSVHKITRVLASAHHLMCARDWRVVLDRTAVGWEVFDLVHRSDRAVYSNER